MKNTNETKSNTINNVPKPISLVIGEFRENLAKTINESGLHISLIEMVVKEIYLEVCNQAEVISIREKNEYKKHLDEMNENIDLQILEGSK